MKLQQHIVSIISRDNIFSAKLFLKVSFESFAREVISQVAHDALTIFN